MENRKSELTEDQFWEEKIKEQNRLISKVRRRAITSTVVLSFFIIIQLIILLFIIGFGISHEFVLMILNALITGIVVVFLVKSFKEVGKFIKYFSKELPTYKYHYSLAIKYRVLDNPAKLRDLLQNNKIESKDDIHDLEQVLLKMEEEEREVHEKKKEIDTPTREKGLIQLRKKVRGNIIKSIAAIFFFLLIVFCLIGPLFFVDLKTFIENVSATTIISIMLGTVISFFVIIDSIKRIMFSRALLNNISFELLFIDIDKKYTINRSAERIKQILENREYRSIIDRRKLELMLISLELSNETREQSEEQLKKYNAKYEKEDREFQAGYLKAGTFLKISIISFLCFLITNNLSEIYMRFESNPLFHMLVGIKYLSLLVFTLSSVMWFLLKFGILRIRITE